MRRSSPRRTIVTLSLSALLACAVSIACVPAVLAFPYAARIGDTQVHADMPIEATRLRRILADADRRVAASGIADPRVARTLYLTDGGWRWKLLAPTMRNAFAVTRPVSSGIVLNASDIAADRMLRDPALPGSRTLSGTIAHETTHLLVNHRYGPIRARLFPAWKVEGYCDHVAQESSLSDTQAAQLRQAGSRSPALAYRDGRMRVAAALRADPNVDHLFLGK